MNKTTVFTVSRTGVYREIERKDLFTQGCLSLVPRMKCGKCVWEKDSFARCSHKEFLNFVLRRCAPRRSASVEVKYLH